MSTPTKTPGLPQGIITPSCDVTPTRETARDDGLYDDFALTQNDCSDERGVNDAERTLLEPTVRKQVRAERRARFAEALSAAVRRACLRAVGVGVLVGAAVYYFHDDGTDFQVPARAVHHAEQALVHLKLALDVARQLHLIS